MITATLDPSMLPDGLQEKIEEVVQKIDPRHRSVDFNRVLNPDENGHRRFGFYVKVGAPWNCMVCGRTHENNNFALQWSERTKAVSLFCIRASQKQVVQPVAELERWAPRQMTHYDTLGVNAGATADDIIAAAAMPPENARMCNKVVNRESLRALFKQRRVAAANSCGHRVPQSVINSHFQTQQDPQAGTTSHRDTVNSPPPLKQVDWLRHHRRLPV